MYINIDTISSVSITNDHRINFDIGTWVASVLQQNIENSASIKHNFLSYDGYYLSGITIQIYCED